MNQMSNLKIQTNNKFIFEPTIPSPRMFWEFCSMRMERWWNEHLGLEPPYSDDPVLDQGIDKVPNVFRELDNPNIYVTTNMRGRETKDAIMATVSFRLTNKIPPHETFEGPPRVSDMDDWEQHLRQKKSQGMPLFTRIFHTPPFEAYIESLRSYVECADELASQIDDAQTLEEAFNHLRRIPRVANFFAWQCSADLMESGHLNRFDEDTWVYLGPGPLRALAMMYGGKFSQKEAMVYARKFWEVQDEALKNTKTPWRPPPLHLINAPESRLTMKNIEHALCEYLRWVNAHWSGRYT